MVGIVKGWSLALILGKTKAEALGLSHLLGGKVEIRRAAICTSLEKGMWRVGVSPKNDSSRAWVFVNDVPELTLREATAEEYAAFFVKK